MDKLIRLWFDKALLSVAKGLVQFFTGCYEAQCSEAVIVGDSALTPNNPWLGKSFYRLNHFV
jgi:hypothetical protein